MNYQEALTLVRQNKSKLSPEQLRLVEQIEQKFQGKQGMTHTPPTPVRDLISRQLGAEVRNESDIPFLKRADLGLTDTPGEFDTKFKALFPDYELQRVPAGKGLRSAELVYRKPGEEFYRRYDEPGLSFGDVADMSGVAPEIAMGLGAMAIPGMRESYGINILKAATGAASGYLAKEGVEEARGYQQEPVSDVLGRAAMIAGLDATLGAIPWAGSAIRGAKGQASAGIRTDAQKIQAMLDQNPGFESIMGVQANPSSPLADRLFRQSASTSPDLKAKLERQEVALVDAVEQMGEAYTGKLGSQLRRLGRNSISSTERDILKRYGVKTAAGPERVGKAAQDALEDFNTGSRAAINEAYGKVRTEVTPDMAWDLSPVKAMKKDMGVYATQTDEVPGSIVDLQGRPLTIETIEQLVDVTAPGPQQVSQVMRLIDQIDPVQANWEVIKHLRTKVGNAIERWPSDAKVGTGQAKRLWGALTDVLQNPANATKGYQDALGAASKIAKDRFEVYEKPSILKLMKGDNYAEIANTMAQPHGVTQVVRDTIRQWSPQKADKVAEHIQYRILSENDPKAYRESMMRDNPEIIEWAVPRSQRAAFAKATEEISNLRNSPLAKIVNSEVPDAKVASNLLKQTTSPREVDALIRQYGGRGSDGHDLLRYSVLNDAANSLIKFKSDGTPTINKIEFGKFISQSRKNGVWNNVLTKQDRTNLAGLEAYARRAIKNLNDTGTSLEQAQLIAGLKHPNTMLSSIHGLAVNNRVIAPLLMSPKWGKVIAGSTQARRKHPKTWTGLTTLMATMSEMAQREEMRGWYTEPFVPPAQQ